MAGSNRWPTLYEVHVRSWVRRLGRALGRPATLHDVPDAELDRLADLGFDWLWCLGVWQTGTLGREIARSLPALRREYERALPDLTEDDICGSGFAVAGYEVHPALGGLPALGRLRERLRARGIRLLLDFVPNHTALDHPWVASHPEFYVQRTETDLQREPHNHRRVETSAGPRVLAHGRDPFFPGWTDTLQLDYGKPELQDAMRGELLKIAACCDGVRCDMAMLVLPSVFQMTWRTPAAPFWPRAIRTVRAAHPEFLFLAEAYWDLEWTLQQQGFDYTYDKRLYDRLRARQPGPVRDHLRAEIGFQAKLARFLENHDEPRAAEAFPGPVHRAAAVLTHLTPGLRFFHEGQLAGRRLRVPVQLCRWPEEPVDRALAEFYDRLLACVRDRVVQSGAWRLLDCGPAWEGNGSSEAFVAFAWEAAAGRRLLAAVNYGESQAQCYVRLPFPDLAGRAVELRDRLGPAAYRRHGDPLLASGLYLDLPPWGVHVFDVVAVA
jgi:hypothetical protein